MRIALLQVNTKAGDVTGNMHVLLEACEQARQQGAGLCVAPELALCGYPALGVLHLTPLSKVIANHVQYMAQALKKGPALLLGIPEVIHEEKARCEKASRCDEVLCSQEEKRNPDEQGQTSTESPCKRVPVTNGEPFALDLTGKVKLDLDNAARLYDTVLLLNQGVVTRICRKHHLGKFAGIDENAFFISGDRAESHGVVVMDNLRMAVCLGHDVDCLPAWSLTSGLPVSAVDMVIHMAAEAFNPHTHRALPAVLSRVARLWGTPLVHVNPVGGNGSVVCSGQSQVVRADGSLLHQACLWEEEVLVFDAHELSAQVSDAHELSAELSTQVSGVQELNVQVSGVQELNVQVSGVQELNAQGSDAQELNAQGSDAQELNAQWQALVLGTRDYVRKSGFQRVVLGLSGGMDSSLVAAIAVEALGATQVTGLIMPSPWSSVSSFEDAQALTTKLGLRVHTLSIEPLMAAYDAALAPLFVGLPRDVTEENIQARIRGNLLMALSNKEGSLLLATGNKSEVAVGYCTLYGDAAGGLAPIADVYKTRVYQLARWYNTHKGTTIIPENVFDKAPSAELRPDQKDQDSLPPYDELDAILYALIEERLFPHMVCAMHPDFDPQQVARVAELMRKSEFKRHQLPPALFVSPRPLAALHLPVPMPLTRNIP